MKIFSMQDSYSDDLSFTDYEGGGYEESDTLWAAINAETEVKLTVENVKNLRRALKHWLIANGHKAQVSGRFGEV